MVFGVGDVFGTGFGGVVCCKVGWASMGMVLLPHAHVGGKRQMKVCMKPGSEILLTLLV